METKDEIIYYCKEKQPVGALMLTGEWGCGKTYLIENTVKEELKDSHIIVRVSLFGVSSIDELNRTVKKRWVDECAPFFKNSDDEGVLALGKALLNTLEKFSAKAELISKAALSINPIDFVSMKPTVDNQKNVVLVFDDLERSKLNTVDILGCINEYCENMKFHVVIIANEEKIEQYKTMNQETSINENAEKENDSSIKKDAESQIIYIYCDKNNEGAEISYREIKEKIVCRTVRYNPDYSSIIKSIIEKESSGFSDKYVKFLNNHIENIIDIFEYEPQLDIEEHENERKNIVRPRNIRSLKCALHDFERIFVVFTEEKMSETDIKDGLISFIAYTLAAKANLVNKSNRYGYIFSNDRLENMFPFLNIKTLFVAEKEWVLDGVWDKKHLLNEIKRHNEIIAKLEKSKEPQEILKSNRIFDVDDDDIKKGFRKLLKECYSGELDFDEYIQFICNAFTMRKYHFPQYADINWGNINEGINNVIEKIRKSGNYTEMIKNNRYTRRLEDDLIKDFSEDELLAYDTIVNFIDDDAIILEQNCQNYIDAMQKENSINTLKSFKSKRFDRFDKEMANVTVACYASCSQSDKTNFPNYFRGMWGGLDREKLFKKNDTIDGLQTFEDRLEELKEEYLIGGKTIAKISVEELISRVKSIKEKYMASL